MRWIELNADLVLKAAILVAMLACLAG